MISLSLRGCENFSEFSFMELCSSNIKNSLLELDISYCRQLTDVSLIFKYLNLSSLNMSGCEYIKEIIFPGKINSIYLNKMIP